MRVVFLGVVFFSAGAFAAPDETALGKDEGYPVCPPSLRPETRCLIGLVSPPWATTEKGLYVSYALPAAMIIVRVSRDT